MLEGAAGGPRGPQVTMEEYKGMQRVHAAALTEMERKRRRALEHMQHMSDVLAIMERVLHQQHVHVSLLEEQVVGLGARGCAASLCCVCAVVVPWRAAAKRDAPRCAGHRGDPEEAGGEGGQHPRHPGDSPGKLRRGGGARGHKCLEVAWRGNCVACGVGG